MNQNSEVLQIPIEDLVPNRFQPRINFDEKALNDLANSIKQHGIIQPLVVRRIKDKYEIIAGERRYKAAQIAGLISVPALVTDVNDESSAEIALVENVQRKDLSSIEEAKSYKNILETSDMTQEELAKKMGVSQSSVANKLRLLNLGEEVQQALLEGKISERHARSLLAIEDESVQSSLLRRVIDERLTVKQLDEEIKNIIKPVRDDVVDDVPLVNIDENIDLMKREATDIVPKVENVVYNQPQTIEEPPVETGKFFKYSIPEEKSADSFSFNDKIEPTVQNIPMSVDRFLKENIPLEKEKNSSQLMAPPVDNMPIPSPTPSVNDMLMQSTTPPVADMMTQSMTPPADTIPIQNATPSVENKPNYNMPPLPGEPSFFNFGAQEDDSLSPIAMDSSVVPVNHAGSMVEEVLDITTPVESINDTPDGMIETLEIEQSAAIFDDHDTGESVDLPYIINKVRDFINGLNNNNVKMSELDTENSYKIEIEIEKNPS